MSHLLPPCPPTHVAKPPGPAERPHHPLNQPLFPTMRTPHVGAARGHHAPPHTRRGARARYRRICSTWHARHRRCPFTSLISCPRRHHLCFGGVTWRPFAIASRVLSRAVPTNKCAGFTHPGTSHAWHTYSPAGTGRPCASCHAHRCANTHFGPFVPRARYRRPYPYASTGRPSHITHGDAGRTPHTPAPTIGAPSTPPRVSTWKHVPTPGAPVARVPPCVLVSCHFTHLRVAIR